jgi:beta-lactamase class A
MLTLTDQIAAIIAASGATAMGVAVKHLESDTAVYLDADRPFPLCSVVKTPILCEAFRQIHAGKFALTDRWELTLAEKNLPSGVLVFLEEGLRPTVRDLLTLMIIISDNTATDMVLHRVGTAAVNQYMHALGLADTHIVMTIREIFEDILPSADPRQVLADLDKRPAHPDEAKRTGRAYRLDSDNNVGSARDLNRLLELIWQGAIVDRATSDAILHILLQQQLDTRLPRFLPSGTPFAHKTGTLSGIRNDSGILYCNDHAHVAITVFSTWDAAAVKGDPVAAWARMTAIDSAFGQIGRAVYDQFQG